MTETEGDQRAPQVRVVAASSCVVAVPDPTPIHRCFGAQQQAALGIGRRSRTRRVHHRAGGAAAADRQRTPRLTGTRRTDRARAELQRPGVGTAILPRLRPASSAWRTASRVAEPAPASRTTTSTWKRLRSELSKWLPSPTRTTPSGRSGTSPRPEDRCRSSDRGEARFPTSHHLRTRSALGPPQAHSAAHFPGTWTPTRRRGWCYWEKGKQSSRIGRLLAPVPPSSRPTQAVNHALFIQSPRPFRRRIAPMEILVTTGATLTTEMLPAV
jgi:hypothetical protein